MKKLFRNLTFGIGCAALSGVAFGSVCGSTLLSVQSNPSLFGYYQSQYPECFPSGGSNTISTQSIGVTSFQQMSLITTGLGQRLLGAQGPALNLTAAASPLSGLAAGGPTAAWNVWANASQNESRYGVTTAGGLTRNDIDVTNTAIGLDYRFNPTMVAGVSVAWDRGHGSYFVPPASSTPSGSKGYAIAPYFGWQLSDKLAFDASIGFGDGYSHITGLVKTETDTKRFFYGANLTYSQWIKNWQLTGKGSYFYAQEKADDFKLNGAAIIGTAAKSKLDRIKLGAEAGYWYGNGVMPFVGLALSQDMTRSNTPGGLPWDKSAFSFVAGVNFFAVASGVTGGVVYSDEFSRSNSKNSSLMMNINFRF